MTGVSPHFVTKFKFSGSALRMPSIPDPLSSLLYVRAHGFQVSDTKFWTACMEADTYPKSVIQKVLCRTDVVRRPVLRKRHGLRPNDKIMIYQAETSNLPVKLTRFNALREAADECPQKSNAFKPVSLPNKSAMLSFS